MVTYALYAKLKKGAQVKMHAKLKQSPELWHEGNAQHQCTLTIQYIKINKEGIWETKASRHFQHKNYIFYPKQTTISSDQIKNLYCYLGVGEALGSVITLVTTQFHLVH